MELDMNLMNTIFGIRSQEDWDDDLSNTHRAQEQRAEVQDTEAEARAADFEQDVARADLSVFDAQSPWVFWVRLNTGPFGSRMGEQFGYTAYEDRMMVRDADRCDAQDARENSHNYQALQRIRREQPELYAIIMARTAYARAHADEMVDRGPFGNDWGE